MQNGKGAFWLLEKRIVWEICGQENMSSTYSENEFAHKFWIELNINERSILNVQIHFECALVVTWWDIENESSVITVLIKWLQLWEQRKIT